MDTLIWLAGFPATHGYAMVFIAGFGLMGLGYRSITNPGRLTALERRRRDAGEDLPAGIARRRVAGNLQTAFYRLLAIVVISGGVIGMVSLSSSEGPITNRYVAEHGATTYGTLDGDYVTFTATDGRTYTLYYDFFTPQSVEEYGFTLSAGPVIVHYLESHPQAYMLEEDPRADE